MNKILPFLLISIISLKLSAQNDTLKEIIWEINNLDTIGGLPVSLIGDPVLIEVDDFKAVEFDGVDDGLLINSNPLAGATEFTLEVIFNPYPDGPEEQRFVHIQQDNNNRALIELRSTAGGGWFLDTFIKSGSSSKALYAEDYIHSTNEWWHAGLVYKNGLMTHYVGGVEEMSGSVNFEEVNSGATSLGVRQNLVSWFKGAIKTLKVTHRALEPDEFLKDVSIVSIAQRFADGNQLFSRIYPNPVTDMAQIIYQVEKPARVVLKIYNMQTGQLAELVNQYQEAGDYSEILHCKNLPSGIYFYTLTIGQKIRTEKFIVMD